MHAELNQEKITRLDMLSSFFNASKSESFSDQLPPEISEALNMARTEMNSVSQTVHDLKLARENLDELSRTVSRLTALADEASNLPDEDQEERDSLQEEFVRLARVVARLAGRRHYHQPDLSLKSRPQARAAGQTLKLLIPVNAALDEQLSEQEAAICAAIEATWEFLQIVGQAYPEAVEGWRGFTEGVEPPAGNAHFESNLAAGWQ